MDSGGARRLNPAHFGYTRGVTPGHSQDRSTRFGYRPHSPPDQGRANDELIAFVAASLSLPRTALELTNGASSRHERLHIATPDPAAVISQLIALAAAPDA